MKKSYGTLIALTSLLAIAACSNDSSSGSGSTGTVEATAPAEASETTAATGSVPVTVAETSPAATEVTASTIPEVVPFEGSMADLVAQQPSLSNISEAIAAWLAASPGREGVLRNGAGVTLFLPDDNGFTDADVATAIADFDAFTIFLSEHLKVGVVLSDQLGTEVTTAMANTYPVGDGPTIGGQAVIEADIEGTNGVLHILAGPLAPLTAEA